MSASTKAVAFGSVAVVIVLLQFTLLTAALDFVTSFVLFGIGFVAGKTSK